MKEEINLYEFQIYLSKNGIAWESYENGIRRVTVDEILKKLHYQVFLENGFTLRSYFKFVKYYYWAVIFLDDFFHCFLEEYDECPGSNCLSEELDYLVLDRFAAFNSEKQIRVPFNKNEIIDVNDEIEMGCHFYGYSEKEKTPYSLICSNLSELLDHEIKIGKSKLSVELPGNYEDYDNLSDKIIYREAEDISGYSLFEFLHNIIWELSFFGCKENREKEKGEILNRSKDE